jgi:hypothetical protein
MILTMRHHRVPAIQLEEVTAKKGDDASVAWVSQRLMDLDVEYQDALEGEVVAHAGAG